MSRKTVIRFVSESMKLSGFSGRITARTRNHRPDVNSIAASAKKFGAQVPRRLEVLERLAKLGKTTLDLSKLTTEQLEQMLYELESGEPG